MNNCIKMQFSLMQCGLTIIVVFFSIFSSHKKKKEEKIKHLHNIQSGQVFVLLQYIFPDTYMPAIIHAHISCIHIYIYIHTQTYTHANTLTHTICKISTHFFQLSALAAEFWRVILSDSNENVAAHTVVGDVFDKVCRTEPPCILPANH